jgi:hypothetical protein
MRAIDVLADDWDRLRRLFPDREGTDLAGTASRLGHDAAEEPFEVRVPADLPPAERVQRLTMQLARSAGGVALQRFRLVTERERDVRAEHDEAVTYERHLELEKDVVPPLKLEAKRLRAELRALEAQARGLGIDVDALEPRIAWPDTIAVDGYEPPRYETNDQRRETAVAFFRRVGGT